MMAVAPRDCDGCPPCRYQRFEDHRDECFACLRALTAHGYCAEGLALLNAALGEVDLPLPAPVPPTNAMTRDLGEIALSALADELRLYTVIYQHSPTSADEVRPWGGDVCEVRDRAVKRFVAMNRLVRLGVVSDWKAP